MFRKLTAECFGTFWLVLAAFPVIGIGFVGVGAGVWFDRHDDGVCCRTYFGGDILIWL